MRLFKKSLISLALLSSLGFSAYSFSNNGPNFDFSVGNNRAQGQQASSGGQGQSQGQGQNQGQGSSNRPPDPTIEVRDEYIYPDVPVDIPGFDEEIKLYDDELKMMEAKERALLKQLYEFRRMRETQSLMREHFREESLDESKRSVSDLTPGQIRELREWDKQIIRATNEPLDEIHQQIRSVEVDVNSNQAIEVHLAPNNQASIVFYDRGGNPWPVDGEPEFNESAFNAQVTHSKGHVIVFTLDEPFSQSNAMVSLEGLDIPIILKLVGSENRVDSRLSARLPTFGPQMNETPEVYNMVDNASPELLEVLNGDPLSGSLEYEIEGVSDAKAYYRDGDLYIRSKSMLLAPPPKSTSSLPSGYRSFVIPAKRDLLFSVDGQYVEARVKKKEQVEIQKRDSIFNNR